MFDTACSRLLAPAVGGSMKVEAWTLPPTVCVRRLPLRSVPVTDRLTRGIAKAQILVAALGHSSYTFAEATATQNVVDRLGSHVRAFEFFGAVPACGHPGQPEERGCARAPLRSGSEPGIPGSGHALSPFMPLQAETRSLRWQQSSLGDRDYQKQREPHSDRQQCLIDQRIVSRDKEARYADNVKK